MLKLVALSLLIVTISAQELGADDILEDITSGAKEEWGAPAPAPAPAAAPGEAPVPAHKGGWKGLANKTTGWWKKHAHASAPASDGKKHGAGWWGKHAKAPAAAPKRRRKGYGKRRGSGKKFSWGNAKKSSKKLYGKRRGSGSGSGSGKKKFSWGKIKTKGKSWFKKVPHKKGSWGKLKTKGKKLYGKRRGSGSGSGKKFSWGKIKTAGKSWFTKIKKRRGGIAWTIPSAGSGSGAVACPKVGKLPAASAKTTCAKAGCNYSEDKSNPFKTVRTCSRGSGSGSGSGFKKRKGGIAWTIPSAGSGGGAVACPKVGKLPAASAKTTCAKAGCNYSEDKSNPFKTVRSCSRGSSLKKRKGGVAWTIPSEADVEADLEMNSDMKRRRRRFWKKLGKHAHKKMLKHQMKRRRRRFFGAVQDLDFGHRSHVHKARWGSEEEDIDRSVMHKPKFLCLPCPVCPVGQFAADEEVQLDERGCPKCTGWWKKCRPVVRAPCKCAKPACPKCDEYADEYEELEVQAIPCLCPSVKCRACAMKMHHLVLPPKPKPVLLRG